MVAPRKYPEELRERSIRMTLDARQDPASRPSACRRIGEQLGINPETLRGWVIQAEVDAGARPGATTAEAARLGELEREDATPGSDGRPTSSGSTAPAVPPGTSSALLPYPWVGQKRHIAHYGFPARSDPSAPVDLPTSVVRRIPCGSGGPAIRGGRPWPARVPAARGRRGSGVKGGRRPSRQRCAAPLTLEGAAP